MIIEPPAAIRVRDLQPARTYHHHNEVDPLESLADRPDEVVARTDYLHIEKDMVRTQLCAGAVVNTTGPPGRILTSIGNEHTRHRNPPSTPSMQWHRPEGQGPFGAATPIRR